MSIRQFVSKTFKNVTNPNFLLNICATCKKDKVKQVSDKSVVLPLVEPEVEILNRSKNQSDVLRAAHSHSANIYSSLST